MKRFFVFVLIIFAVGCAKKYIPQPVTPAKTEPEIAIEKPERIEVVEEKIFPPGPEEIGISESEAEKALSEFKDVLFDYDKYTIRPDARIVLDSIADWLNKNKKINVIIEGHCDERGTNEYNLALGEKRANAARDYLIVKGIAPARMSTITYGEEKPVCTQSNESCWQRNRRAHFVIVR